MTTAIDDVLWSAIGDPTRRRILDLLLAQDATASGLSEHLPITRQAVSKHLAVLDRSGLVHPSANGREVRYRLDRKQFAVAVAQLTAVGATWDSRLNRIAGIAEELRRDRDATASHTPTVEA